MAQSIHTPGIGTIEYNEIRNEIGSGKYARVFFGTFTTQDTVKPIDVAIKRISNEEISPFERDSMPITWIGDHHPNILRYYNSLKDNDFTYV